MVKKAYPGTISSVILSVLVVMMLLLPFYTANHLQKVRDGDDKYEFKEVMCWDLNDESQLQPDNYVTNPVAVYGTGAVLINYHTIVPPNAMTYTQMPTDIISIPRDNVVGKYMGSSMVKHPQWVEDHILSINIYTTLTKSIILENDVTRISLYLDFGSEYEVQFEKIRIYMNGFSFKGYMLVRENCYYLGTIINIDLTVDDLLKLNTFEPEDILVINFVRFTEPFLPHEGHPFIFDMQFYHIEEFKIITIDYMGIAMIGGGLFMIFCSILMLPHVTFSGVIGRLFGKRS